MKILLFQLSLLFISTSLTSQSDKPLSPPQSLEASIEGVDITIEYNAPSVRDRKLFGSGGLEPFDEVWRTGANEATRITFSKDVSIEGEALAKGTYSLFTIPGESEWTYIFNSVIKQWGDYSYDSDKDVLRVVVKANAEGDHTEMMNFAVSGSKIILRWGNVEVPFLVSRSAQ